MQVIYIVPQSIGGGRQDAFQIIEEGPAGWFLLNLLLWAAVFADYL